MLPFASRCGTLRQCRTEEGFEFQAVQLRTADTLVLNEHLERAAHAIRLQEMNGCAEPGAFRVQSPDHLFNTEPHQKTHLVREPRHVESVLLTDGSQAREIYVGSHILLTDTHEWIVVRSLLEVAKERAILPLRPVEVLRCMAVIDRQDKPTVYSSSNLLHPVHREQIHLGSITLRPRRIQLLELLNKRECR
jgi:hypothetical protein